jgi:hypothetical protein
MQKAEPDPAAEECSQRLAVHREYELAGRVALNSSVPLEIYVVSRVPRIESNFERACFLPHMNV